MRQVSGFFPGPPVSSTNKTDLHDIAEILLKVALNTIKQINLIKHFCFEEIHNLFFQKGILLVFPHINQTFIDYSLMEVRYLLLSIGPLLYPVLSEFKLHTMVSIFVPEFIKDIMLTPLFLTKLNKNGGNSQTTGFVLGGIHINTQ